VRRVLSSLRLEPKPLQQAVVFGLQLDERSCRRGRGNDSARLAAAKRRQAVQAKLERLPMDAAKNASDFVGQGVVDVTDEPQREMVVFRVDPTRPRQAAAHHGEGLANRLRHFDSGEQAGHDNLRNKQA
jgi:hypothetical protein